MHGRGPFLTSSAAENALTIQLFMIVFSIPLLMLAAVMEERRDMEMASRENEERLNLTLSAAQLGTWEWRVGEDSGWWSEKSNQILGLPPDQICPWEHSSAPSFRRTAAGAKSNSGRAGRRQAIRM